MYFITNTIQVSQSLFTSIDVVLFISLSVLKYVDSSSTSSLYNSPINLICVEVCSPANEILDVKMPRLAPVQATLKYNKSRTETDPRGSEKAYSMGPYVYVRMRVRRCMCVCVCHPRNSLCLSLSSSPHGRLFMGAICVACGIYQFHCCRNSFAVA